MQMSELDILKRLVNESSELSKRGEHLKALEILDDGIARAVRENRPIWIRVLSRHASALADEMGDLGLVREYRERCAADDPDNPLALCSLANVLHRLGEDDLGKQHALRSYRLSSRLDTEVHRALVESLLQMWPDLQRDAN
jgi:hypothetical protein